MYELQKLYVCEYQNKVMINHFVYMKKYLNYSDTVLKK